MGMRTSAILLLVASLVVACGPAGGPRGSVLALGGTAADGDAGVTADSGATAASSVAARHGGTATITAS